MIALETLTGMDTRLSVEDIFNRMFSTRPKVAI